MKWFLALSLVVSVLAITTRTESGGNPIRKVVRMMEKMSSKIEKEAEKEEDLYDKFSCYCKKTIAELEKSIQEAEQSPISQADIDAKKSQIVSLQQEVAKLKEDRLAEEESLKAAEAQRSKEHANFVEEVTEEKAVVQSVDQASAALKGNSFLQTNSSQVSRVLRAVQSNLRLDTSSKNRLAAFLSGEQSADPGYVAGMLEGLKEDTEAEIQTETKTEDQALETFQGVETSKKTEISALLNTFQRKMSLIGELKVQVVNMEREMDEQGDSIEDDKKMLAELQKSCGAKAKDWELRKAARAEELVALQDTIKMLNSDESLDLFRNKSPALIQLSSNREQVRRQAVKILSSKDSRPELNFLALALTGRKADFTKVLEKIDGMVTLLKQEAAEDEQKQQYCEKEFRTAEAKGKTLAQKAETLAASVAEKKDVVAKLRADLVALKEGVVALDASVAKASENRRAEHAEFQESMSSNSAALELLSLARNRLNKVYNPSMFVATTTKSPYDPYAMLQSFLQLNSVQAAPATFEGDYQKKTQESNGVLKMIDTLAADLDKEMAVAKTEESDAQADYEETVQDAAKKREADMTLATQKTQDKAELETDMNSDKQDMKDKEQEISTAAKYVEDLHGECDWLLKNFDLRASARSEEKDSLIRAKTVLSGM